MTKVDLQRRRQLVARLRRLRRCDRWLRGALLHRAFAIRLGAGVAIVLAAATFALGCRNELSRFGYQWLGPREQDLHTSAPPYMDWDIHGILFGALAFLVGTVCLAAPAIARRQHHRRRRPNQRARA